MGLLLGLPKGGPKDDDESDGVMSEEQHFERLAKALKGGDAKAGVSAFKDLLAACEGDYDEEE